MKTLRQLMVVGLGTLLVVTGAYAEELMLNFRNVQQKADDTMHSQSEDKSTGAGTYRTQGLTFLEDGTVATYVSQGAFSYSGKGSWHTGYSVRTYPDGSTTTGHFTGQSREGTAPLEVEWEGTAQFVDGTGRFEGATGTGTYVGGRYANGMSVTEVEAKFTLAEQ